jgi:hypothetical protein
MIDGIRISNLTEVYSADADDYLVINTDDITTNKISFENFKRMFPAAVYSVNGYTGEVVLTAHDVGAYPKETVDLLLDQKADKDHHHDDDYAAIDHIHNISELNDDIGIIALETDPIFIKSPAYVITWEDVAHFRLAYSWGDHSVQGYLTDELDPVFNAHVSSGITQVDIDRWNEAYAWGDHSGAIDVELDPIFTSSPAYTITVQDISDWNLAYSWGNHATVGYLTSETDPTVPDHVKDITQIDIDRWNETYGYGDHSIEGYLKDITNERLGDLLDVDFTVRGPVSGDALIFNGSTWGANTPFIDGGLRFMYVVDVMSDNPAADVRFGDIYIHIGADGDSALSWGPDGINPLVVTNGDKLALGRDNQWHIIGNIYSATGSDPGMFSVTTGSAIDGGQLSYNNLTGEFTFRPADISNFLEKDTLPKPGLLKTDAVGDLSAVPDNSSDWNTAFGWGDHSVEGYLKDIDGPFLTVDDLTLYPWYDITDLDINNWNEAHGWGNHAEAGYLKPDHIEVTNTSDSLYPNGHLELNTGTFNPLDPDAKTVSFTYYTVDTSKFVSNDDLTDALNDHDLEAVCNFGNDAKQQIEATSFKTTGGTNLDFVKGDGSLDNTSYATVDQLNSSQPMLSDVCDTGIHGANANNAYNDILAYSFIVKHTNGVVGKSTEFLKADGSLDTTKYLPYDFSTLPTL